MLAVYGSGSCFCRTLLSQGSLFNFKTLFIEAIGGFLLPGVGAIYISNKEKLILSFAHISLFLPPILPG